MFTLVFDKTGKVIAKSQYSEHQNTLPSDQIECNEEQFLKCQNYEVVEGKILPIGDDVILTALKTALCAKIDQRAIEVGDAQIKGSVYLSSEYQRNATEAAAWANGGFEGEAPAAILVGAESHGISAQAEAELILLESDMAEGLIETLRSWRMNAKGLNGIQGATTVEAAQAVFDAAIFDLEKAIGSGR
jgi:hypothetical protein